MAKKFEWSLQRIYKRFDAHGNITSDVNCREVLVSQNIVNGNGTNIASVTARGDKFSEEDLIKIGDLIQQAPQLAKENAELRQRLEYLSSKAPGLETK